MPIRGAIGILNHVAAEPCTISIWFREVVTHGFLLTWSRGQESGVGFLVGRRALAWVLEHEPPPKIRDHRDQFLFGAHYIFLAYMNELKPFYIF